MISLEVKLNGERACMAGAVNLFVLNAILGIGGQIVPATEASRQDQGAPMPTVQIARHVCCLMSVTT
jgi:ABC-type transporter lipoprotein component MlaA